MTYANDELGIEIVDVRGKRIDLPQEVSSSVFQRMQAERQEVAKTFRSRGEEEARKIRARAEREREVLIAEARRDSERTRGEGDAAAAEIYAKAYTTRRRFLRAISFFERVPSEFWWKSGRLVDEARFRVLPVLQRPNGKQ